MKTRKLQSTKKEEKNFLDTDQQDSLDKSSNKLVTKGLFSISGEGLKIKMKLFIFIKRPNPDV